MNFSKMQGTGNDFILVDARNVDRNWPELAQIMCQRHFGVGADGLILVQNSKVADLKMRIFNSDGSEAEACGNGLRCFAKYAIERGICQPACHSEGVRRPNNLAQGKPRGGFADSPLVLNMTIETLPGVRKAKVRVSQGKVNQVEVNMGVPQFEAEQIPVALPQAPSLQGRGQGWGETKQSPLLDYSLQVAGQKLPLSCVSMGNPHAVSFTSRPVDDFPLSEVGPEVERHAIFPQRTNFEIARVLSSGKIEARVWERGVGETLACGSGACAIAVVAHLLSQVGTEVDIMLRGGVLTVLWDGVGEVVLSGPVEEVFSGQYPDSDTKC